MEPAKEKVFDFRLEVVVNNGVKITARKGQMDTWPIPSLYFDFVFFSNDCSE